MVIPFCLKIFLRGGKFFHYCRSKCEKSIINLGRKRTYDVTERGANMKTDVLIIGGGVIGCGIAHQLCKYNFDVTLVEKEADVMHGNK